MNLIALHMFVLGVLALAVVVGGLVLGYRIVKAICGPPNYPDWLPPDCFDCDEQFCNPSICPTQIAFDKERNQ